MLCHFSLLDADQPSSCSGKEIISRKRVDKRNGKWTIQKKMIYFEFDSRKQMIILLVKKSKLYGVETIYLLRKKRVQLKKFQTLMGKIRHYVLIMPSVTRFFTLII